MTQNNHVKLLLKNLQNGLKTHSVEELNAAIAIAINSGDRKKSDIDYVLKLVMKAYKINLKVLIGTHSRGIVIDAKQTAYCLLHLGLGLSIRYIAKKIFYNWSSSVLLGIKRYRNANFKVKTDREFINTYDALKIELDQYITNKNK